MRRWMLPILVLLAAGCARQTTEEGGVVHRSHTFPMIFEVGMAVAPVGHVVAVEDAAEISAFLSNEIYVGLLIGMEGAPLLGPQDVVDQLAMTGDEAFAAFRDFRRDRFLDRPLDTRSCAELSRLILHRYVLLTWVEEEEDMSMEELSQDYTEVGFANDVRRASFTTVKGVLHGELIDLWEAETLWEGGSPYRSQRVFGEDANSRQEIERARAEGALHFVQMFSGR